jgi:excisionase family DNA binding protein
VNVHELPARPPAVTAPDRYLSRAELADYLGVCVKTIDRNVREGCPSHTFGRRLRRFRVAEVERWLHGRAV